MSRGRRSREKTVTRQKKLLRQRQRRRLDLPSEGHGMTRFLPWILVAAGWMAAAYQSIRLFAADDEIRMLRANADHRRN
jgi:hypothetical protein